ncbi:hypothetical protein [Streptomyces sp. AK02-01A]|uniref:hypothetical protein n=1 Tax=Streptomyces sp. AK02-01A TaxID=3028648 RepID=UPI0029A9AB73|nr:hypothetical protein [Streptomyces sp. AK02-01A]MDX3850973.1 hypothetical protein [Streptomyces sp. AK02-01A]
MDHEPLNSDPLHMPAGDLRPPGARDVPVADSQQLNHSRSSKLLFLGVAVVGTALVCTPLMMSMDGKENVAGLSESALPSATPSPSPRASRSSNGALAAPSPGARSRVTAKSPSPSATVRPPVPTVTVTVRPPKAAEPAAKPTPRWTQTVIHATSELTPGQSWSTNRVTLAFQGDGNLVLYNRDGSPRWQSATVGHGAKALFQMDGNLVVYTADMTPAWSSHTEGHNGAQLVLDRDGVMRIRSGADVLWSSD